jgi:hypothetical protein
MMKILLLSSLILFAAAGQEYHAQKIWLFSKIQYPGNVPVKSNGTQLMVNPLRIICYLKISKKQAMPDWQTANIYGKNYAVQDEQVNQDSVIIGTLKNTDSTIVIKGSNDGKLVQLVLTPKGEIEKPEAWPVILIGTLNGKPVYMRSKEPLVELSPEMMP